MITLPQELRNPDGSSRGPRLFHDHVATGALDHHHHLAHFYGGTSNVWSECFTSPMNARHAAPRYLHLPEFHITAKAQSVAGLCDLARCPRPGEGAGAKDIDERPIQDAPVHALVDLASAVKADLLVVGNVGLAGRLAILGRLFFVPGKPLRQSEIRRIDRAHHGLICVSLGACVVRLRSRVPFALRLGQPGTGTGVHEPEPVGSLERVTVQDRHGG